MLSRSPTTKYRELVLPFLLICISFSNLTPNFFANFKEIGLVLPPTTCLNYVLAHYFVTNLISMFAKFSFI